MKKSLFLLSAFAMLLIASCQPEEIGNVPNPNDPPELTANKTAFSVGNEEGTVTVPIDANYPSIKVTIAGDASSWLSYKETKAETKAEMKTYKVVFSYKANPIATARSGKATINLAAKNLDVTINQAAAIPTIALSLTSRTVNPRGMTFPVKVTTNDDFTATPSADWASFDKEKSEVTVKLNDTGNPREGSIIFKCNADPNVNTTLNFTQKAANVDPELINILSFGDSYTEDAILNLYPVLAELGYTKIRLANVPLDGKTLAEQYEILNGEDKVTLHATEDGINMHVVDTLMVDVLSPDDWDAIVLQPAFEYGGNPDATSVEDIVKLIRTYCEYVPLYWNMTWAYVASSTAEAFKAYGSKQIDMYEAVADHAKQISENPEFEGVIPVGTLVQNLRTSIFEDWVTLEDGAHLTNNIGKLAASYLWAQILSGKTVPKANYYYNTAFYYQTDFLPAMKEAFDNTIAKPFEVTAASAYAPYKFSIEESKAKALIEAASYKFEDYVALPLTSIHNAFYNSTDANKLSNFSSSIAAGYKDNNVMTYATTHLIPKAEIPVGSLIVVLDGYQYRPEGWVTLTTKNNGEDGADPARPKNVTTPVVRVDDAWWKTFTYRAFNVAKKGGGALSDEDMKKLDGVFGIYIPKIAATGGLEDYGNGVWNW